MELNENDMQLIIDALVFTGSVDVGMDDCKARSVEMAELASKLTKETELKTSEDLHFMEGTNEDPDIIKIISPFTRMSKK